VTTGIETFLYMKYTLCNEQCIQYSSVFHLPLFLLLVGDVTNAVVDVETVVGIGISVRTSEHCVFHSYGNCLCSTGYCGD